MKFNIIQLFVCLVICVWGYILAERLEERINAYTHKPEDVPLMLLFLIISVGAGMMAFIIFMGIFMESIGIYY